MRATKESVSAGEEQCEKPTAVSIDDVYDLATD